MNKLLEDAITRMIKIANDDSHGYSQINRWGPDYDCSSLIIQCLEDSGILVKSKGGALNTFTMKKAFEKCGFKAIKYTKMIALQRGDILLNENHHTVMYIGNGQIVHASRSESGGKYGKPGDNDGKELCIRDFYTPKNYSWEWVLRYVEDDESSTGNPYKEPTSTLSIGSTGVGCYWLQWELNEAGASLQLDGDFGKLTKQSLMDFQKAVGIEVDGICGPISRQKLKENTTKVIGVKPKNPYSHNNKLILKKGSKNESVRFVQWELNHRINAGLSEDSSYGKLTENAVKQYQRSVGLSADGVVGPLTWKALES